MTIPGFPPDPRLRAAQAARIADFRFMVVVLAALLLTVQAALAAPFAALVMDARNGKVLLAENADTRLHPASLTKMMTLYIAFEAIKRGEITLETPVKISAKAAAEPPSKLGLKAGQTIQMRYLIRAAAILSANDAATAIGEAISGSEAGFAARMNRTAKALGMKNTTFKNAHGLTQDGHLSTARDMSILGRHLIYDYPQYYNLFSRQSAHAGVRTVTSHNRLLKSYQGADGIKTGYTRAAGFNLTASAQRGKVRVIATVFGGTSTPARDAKVAQLLDLGFKKAKAGAGTVAPPVPDYSVSEDLLLAAVAAPAAAAATGGGKKAALARSPRPRPRPAQAPAVALAAAQPAPQELPEEVLAAIQGSVDAALADVATPETVAEAVAAPGTEADAAAPAALVVAALTPQAPPPRPARLGATPSAAEPAEETLTDLASAETEVIGDTTELAAAEQPAAAPDPAESTLAEAEPAAPVELALAQAVPEAAPPPRPQALADRPEVAEGAPVPDADGLLLAEVPAAAPDLETEAGQELALAAEADEPPPMAPPQSLEALPTDSLPLSDLPSAAEAGQTLLAAITPEVFPDAPAQPEVVSRLSTSGGRHWGVNIGLYGSQYEAERVLLTTALREVSTLGTALRKVSRTPRGFEANFMGMTQDMATLACGRLQARNIGCSTIGG